MIYFIRAIDGGPIKIGYSVEPTQRVEALSALHGKNLAILGCMTGDIAAERRLHRRFAPLRLDGEWFRDEIDLLNFIATEAQPSPVRDDVSVKMNRAVVGKAKAIATYRGITLAEFLTDLVGTPVDKAYGQMLREIDAKGEK